MDWKKTDEKIRKFNIQNEEITNCVGWEECQCNRCKLARLHFNNPEYRDFILSVFRTLKKYSASQSANAESLITDKQNPQQNICKKCGKDFQIYGDINTMICDDCNAD